jgi:hypothetical protein
VPPVVIIDGIRLPFEELLDGWRKFSVRVPHAAVLKSVDGFLDALFQVDYAALAAEVRSVAPLFSYDDDAVDMLGLELWTRRLAQPLRRSM